MEVESIIWRSDLEVELRFFLSIFLSIQYKEVKSIIVRSNPFFGVNFGGRIKCRRLNPFFGGRIHFLMVESNYTNLEVKPQI